MLAVGSARAWDQNPLPPSSRSLFPTFLSSSFLFFFFPLLHFLLHDSLSPILLLPFFLFLPLPRPLLLLLLHLPSSPTLAFAGPSPLAELHPTSHFAGRSKALAVTAVHLSFLWSPSSAAAFTPRQPPASPAPFSPRQPLLDAAPPAASSSRSSPPRRSLGSPLSRPTPRQHPRLPPPNLDVPSHLLRDSFPRTVASHDQQPYHLQLLLPKLPVSAGFPSASSRQLQPSSSNSVTINHGSSPSTNPSRQRLLLCDQPRSPPTSNSLTGCSFRDLLSQPPASTR